MAGKTSAPWLEAEVELDRVTAQLPDEGQAPLDHQERACFATVPKAQFEHVALGF